MSNLVTTYTRLADLRGYSRLNPLVFNIREEGNIFKLVYSEYEPRKSELPVNVLWLEHNTGILRRRSSFEPKDGFNFEWVVVPPESAFYEEQYYDIQPDEIRDLGFGSHSIVGNATVSEEGLVRLLDYNPNAVVVPDSDPRLDNPREPLDHSHADFPRTLVKITPQFAGVLDEAKHPLPGSVLFITEQLSSDTFGCEWRLPKFEEIEWTQPKLVSLNIELSPGAIASDNSKFSLVCSATWTDRTDENAFVDWSIEDNEHGITLSRSGTISCPNLSEDVTVRVFAKKQDPFYKHFVEDTYELRISDLYDQPTGVVIEGADSMYEDTVEHYSYFVLYESGARKVASPKTVTSSIGEISAGTFEPGLVDDDKTAILSAIVKEDGLTLSAEKNIAVIKNSLEELKFMHSGSVVSSLDVDEGSSLQLPSYQVTFKNGQTRVIGFADTAGLQLSSDEHVDDFTLSSIKFGTVVSTEQLRLSNAVTMRGDTVNATLDITIEDVFPFVEELRISGKETVGPDIMTLSPHYTRGGVQASPSVKFKLTAVVDSTESDLVIAFAGMDYTVTWALDNPTNVLKLSSSSTSDASELNLQIDENNSASLTQDLDLNVTATVYIRELDKTFQVTKPLTVKAFDLDDFVGPVFLDEVNGQLTSEIKVNANNDGDAGFNINYWPTVLVPADTAFPITELPEGYVSFASSTSNYNQYRNFTLLNFTCDTHAIEVKTMKIGYNWRTAVWVRGVTPGETFNLTVTDPRINKSFTQQFTVN